MNRSDLAKAVAKEAGMSVQRSEDIVEKLIQVLGRALARGESVCLSNFGTLAPVRPRSARDDNDPESLRVRFKPSSKLAEAVRAGDDQVVFRKRAGTL